MIRTKRLGDLGERWTEDLLRKAGFQSIRDLNKLRRNHPGGDFIADRQGKRYFITVKARNKYAQNRSLNGGYNIYPLKVRNAAREYDAVPAWLTVQIDTERRCFSAYFGTVDSLRNPDAVAVPMSTIAVAGYECLAKDTFDERITADLSNQLIVGTSDLPKNSGSSVSPSKNPVDRTKAASETGGVTDYDRIAVKLLGFSPGTKTQRAVALYLRPEGATTAEVTGINGGPYLNCLKEVEAKGHTIRKWTVIGPNGRQVTAYKIEINGTKHAANTSLGHHDHKMTGASKQARGLNGKTPTSKSQNLSGAELLALESFIQRTVADRRPSSAASNYKGIASGSVFNLLRLHDPALARKIGMRSELVRLAQEMGYSIHAYPSGLGLKGSGIRETIDLKGA